MNFAIILGGLIGFAFGRFSGALLGALVGYWLHRQLMRKLLGGVQQLQSRFLDSTFAVMGALCKADGRVSEQEIRLAEALFDRFHLRGAARESAKQAFRRGKSDGFDLDAEVANFAAASRGQRVLHQLFLQVQLQAIAADGAIHPAEHQMLLRVARGLGLSEAEVRQLEAMLRTGTAGGTGSAGGRSGPPPAVTAGRRNFAVAPDLRTIVSQRHRWAVHTQSLERSSTRQVWQETDHSESDRVLAKPLSY